jgi:predicted flap endonuclease-1-like 5' DNA nuclease
MHRTARNLTALGLGLSVSAIVGWLLLRESKRGRELPIITVKSRSHDTDLNDMPPIVLPLEAMQGSDDATTTGEPTGEDDLTQINDIGPRFAAALRAIGITRFAQLADQTPDSLAERLAPHVTVRPQRIQARNWIGQAAQRAAGESS